MLERPRKMISGVVREVVSVDCGGGVWLVGVVVAEDGEVVGLGDGLLRCRHSVAVHSLRGGWDLKKWVAARRFCGVGGVVSQ